MRCVLALCASVFISGCKSDQSKASDLAERASSWAATAGAVTAAMAENRVPARYAQRTLDDAQKDLETARRQSESLQIADSTRRRITQALAEQSDSLAR